MSGICFWVDIVKHCEPVKVHNAHISSKRHMNLMWTSTILPVFQRTILPHDQIPTSGRNQFSASKPLLRKMGHDCSCRFPSAIMAGHFNVRWGWNFKHWCTPEAIVKCYLLHHLFKIVNDKWAICTVFSTNPWKKWDDKKRLKNMWQFCNFDWWIQCTQKTYNNTLGTAIHV